MKLTGEERFALPKKQVDKLPGLSMKLSGNRTEADMALESLDDAQGASPFAGESLRQMTGRQGYIALVVLFLFYLK